MDGGGFKKRMSIAAKLAGNATELSRKTGISRRAIGTYLAGGSDPTRERLIAIAEASGVSVEWLATGLQRKACPLKEPTMTTNALSCKEGEEIPIPLYTISAQEFSQCDGDFGASTEALYLRVETLFELEFSRQENLRAIYIVGERVTPLGVGHTLLVDCDPNLDTTFEAGVYLLRKGEELRVSIVYPYDTKYVRFIHYVDDDTTEVFDPKRANIKIVGRVVWSCGKVS